METISSRFQRSNCRRLLFLLIIDEYSRFPKVAVVTSTGADEVIMHLDRILATHGISEKMKTDNRPPSNFKDHAKKREFPASTRNARATEFQWSGRKLYAYVAKSSTYCVYRGKRPQRSGIQIPSFLSGHGATGRTLAELLFNKRIATTIPFLKKN